jgi:hypothetical protein
MLVDRFPDPVSIRLPRGGIASFPLALAEGGEVGIVPVLSRIQETIPASLTAHSSLAEVT